MMDTLFIYLLLAVLLGIMVITMIFSRKQIKKRHAMAAKDPSLAAILEELRQLNETLTQSQQEQARRIGWLEAQVEALQDMPKASPKDAP
jgi:uncharacterized membrane protein